MERYRCDPQVLKACKIRKLYGCDGYYLGASCKCANDNQSIMAETEYQELQAYRATGLTVERAAELGKADREGRVVMLPCKIGDTVWFTTVCHGVQPLRIKKIQMYIVVTEEHEYGELPVWDLGKTVFLTREEAEKALEAEQGG